MPITSVTQDPEALTLTVVADFAVPVRRLWDAYADPRQIERFWGPPGWPPPSPGTTSPPAAAPTTP